MNPTPEQEQPKPEIIRVGQEFVLFELGKTMEWKPDSSENAPEFHRDIILQIDTLPELPIRVSAIDYNQELPKLSTMTPFEPDLGYTITREDFTPSTRQKNLKS